jgi:predicted DNA-binding transcriptional regulator YafY
VQYKNTPLEETLRTVFRKISQALPDKITINSSFLDSQVSFISPPVANIKPLTFETIFEALKLQRTIEFSYRPLHKTTWMKRSFDPYHVICSKGNWYSIGFCHYKQEVRMFSFSRMNDIKIKLDRFSIPKEFSPYEFFDKEMGVWVSTDDPYLIELQFDKEVNTYALEYQWHTTQIVKQNDDGSVYVSFETTQLQEVLRWVLGQGHTVKVLGPEVLKDQVKVEIDKIRENYGCREIEESRKNS